MLTAKDILGVNQVGTTHVKDEELFATDYVPNMWYPLGVVLADTPTIANEAARLVKVDYEVQMSVCFFGYISFLFRI